MDTAYETLQLRPDGDWLTVWLNRPESRNALSGQMVAELVAVSDMLAHAREFRGVTLRGRGGVFCAGGDIKGFEAALGTDAIAIARSNRDGGRLFDRLSTLPQVLVVLVEGAAMAGGLGMVCCGDVVAVCADAKFALTETTLGIPPAQIAPFVAERLGLRTARRLMLTAARFGGGEARDLGLADFVATDVTALESIEATLRRQVRRCAPGANAATKEILLASRTLEGEALRDFAAATFAQCMLGEEGREGVASFIEKRKPKWASSEAT